MNEPKPLDLSGISKSLASTQHLTFERGAVDNALKSCAEIIATLNSAINQAKNLQTIAGLDSVESMGQLVRGLGGLAGDKAGAFAQAASAHLTAVEDMRNAIESVAKSYYDSEEEAESHFRSISDNPRRVGSITSDQWSTAESVAGKHVLDSINLGNIFNDGNIFDRTQPTE